MIERYARARDERLFRADDEYVMLHDTAGGHFPVYLRPGDGIAVHARWSAGLARADLNRLHSLVKHTNNHHPWLTATVSDDPLELRIAGRIRCCTTDDMEFGLFTRFVDMFRSSAAELFERVCG